MDTQLLARRLEALGNETRLAVFRVLVRAGPRGVSVGDLQTRTGAARSTLSHHLHKLIDVGLVYQKRERTTLYCHAHFEAMNETLGVLGRECCADASVLPLEGAAATAARG
jgi:DNA-binding transcriptional ArsR family regulator